MFDTRVAASCRRDAGRLAALVLTTLFTASSAHAQIWVESGDAGDLVSTAQNTVGVGTLSQIQGLLASPTDVDVYRVRLTATLPFGTALVGLNCVAIQSPNVWLFDAAGTGLGSSTTCSGGVKQIAALSPSLAPGNYYVAVSFYGLDPQSAAGAMWTPGPPVMRAPDGPGAAGTLSGWAGTPIVQPLNPYQVYFHPLFSFCDAATSIPRSTWGELKTRYGN